MKRKHFGCTYRCTDIQYKAAITITGDAWASMSLLIWVMERRVSLNDMFTTLQCFHCHGLGRALHSSYQAPEARGRDLSVVCTCMHNPHVSAA